jgi:RNA polymerase sigma factor (sigma-70 family)
VEQLVELAQVDVSRIKDPDLTRLLRKHCIGRATNALILRFYPWIRCLIGRHARLAGLSGPDIEDAQQHAVFAVPEAIARYNRRRCSNRDGRSFQRFLRRVLLARFRDRLKQHRRRQKHYDQSAKAIELLQAAPSRRGRAFGAVEDDPAEAAAWQDVQALLDQIKSRFTEPERRLWDRMDTGVPLCAAAAQLGIPYPTARRQWKRLLAAVRARMWRPCGLEGGVPPAAGFFSRN